MVVLTGAMIDRATNRGRSDIESRAEFLEKVTHLHLQDKKLTEVDELSQCHSLEVVYLYSNQIASLNTKALSRSAASLTQLYLQNNELTSLAALESLRNLRILHVGGNPLSVIDSLHNMKQLKELSVSNLKPAPPDAEESDEASGTAEGKVEAGPVALSGRVYFSRETSETLMTTLEVLDVSANHLTSLAPFAVMSNLRELVAVRNDVEFPSVVRLLNDCWGLVNLDLRENPVVKDRHFRKKAVPLGPVLRTLNGEEISSSEKEFLRRLKSKTNATPRG